MTILIKYPRVTKEVINDFIKRKNKELTSLDWAKWAGWFDTDGSFSIKGKGKKQISYRCALFLKDRSPVELFAKTFETNLRYHEHKTRPPKYKILRYPHYKDKVYIAKEYMAAFTQKEKNIWFTENVYPFLLKPEKKEYAVKILGYVPDSKNFSDWTEQEVVHYLATAFEGDGNFDLKKLKNNYVLNLSFSSSDSEYLSLVKYLIEKTFKLEKNIQMREGKTYKTEKGQSTEYSLYLYTNSKSELNYMINKFSEDNVMTMDRKKQNVLNYLKSLN